MKCFFSIIAAAFLISTYGQDVKMYKRDSSLISRSVKDIVELTSATASSAHSNHFLPFTSFSIRNVSADTSFIGVKTKSPAFTSIQTYGKLALPRGTAASIANYLNRNTGVSFAASGSTLTCFIKQLRITPIDSLTKTNDNKGGYYRLAFEAEGYLGKDYLYYPALRLDTIAISFSVDNNDYSLLTQVLDALTTKAAGVDTAKVYKRKGYTYIDLENRYGQRFNKPILTATHFNPGVYKTFTEFVNNAPSVTAFQFKRDKKASLLYTVSESSDWRPERNAFGFCDGKVI